MVLHPSIVQLRNFKTDEIELAKKFSEKLNAEIETTKNGIDIYFEDVNDARFFISKLRKTMNFEIKMSTKYAGLRKGRVRTLFVYSLRRRSE